MVTQLELIEERDQRLRGQLEELNNALNEPITYTIAGGAETTTTLGSNADLVELISDVEATQGGVLPAGVTIGDLRRDIARVEADLRASPIAEFRDFATRLPLLNETLDAVDVKLKWTLEVGKLQIERHLDQAGVHDPELAKYYDLVCNKKLFIELCCRT